MVSLKADVRVTAVICTLNRADYLTRAVRSLWSQTVPRSQYEILIVDNGSTDRTSDAVRALQLIDPSLRYILEPTPGLSVARNTGWRAARGQFIAFLDDDAVASPGWIESIVAAFNSRQDRVGAVGGPIAPLWEAPRPKWLPNELVFYLGELDLGPDYTFVVGPSWLGGGNSAYPSAVLKEAGGFNPNLGRKGNNLLSMEDTCFQMRLISLGYKVLYSPTMRIDHAAPEARLTQEWFSSRSYWDGISEAYGLDFHSFARVVKNLFSIVRVALSLVLRPERLLSFFGKTVEPRRFLQKAIVWRKLGFLVGVAGRSFR